MTRIGRWQIKTRQLAGNASYRRDKLAPLKIFNDGMRYRPMLPNTGRLARRKVLRVLKSPACLCVSITLPASS
jgi:hypothetical protein